MLVTCRVHDDVYRELGHRQAGEHAGTEPGSLNIPTKGLGNPRANAPREVCQCREHHDIGKRGDHACPLNQFTVPGGQHQQGVKAQGDIADRRIHRIVHRIRKHIEVNGDKNHIGEIGLGQKR